MNPQIPMCNIDKYVFIKTNNEQPELTLHISSIMS